MCQLCWDAPTTVRVYAVDDHPCAVNRLVELEVCDHCESAAVRQLEANIGEAHIVRWAA